MVGQVEGKFHWSRVDIFLDSRETRDRPRYSAGTLHITLVRLYAHGTKRSLYTASFYVHRKNAKQACTSAHTSAYTCTRDNRAAAATGRGRSRGRRRGRRRGGGRLPRTATLLSTSSDIIDKRQFSMLHCNWTSRFSYSLLLHLSLSFLSHQYLPPHHAFTNLFGYDMPVCLKNTLPFYTSLFFQAKCTDSAFRRIDPLNLQVQPLLSV